MVYANIKKTVSFLLAVMFALGVFAMPITVSADEDTATEGDIVAVAEQETPAEEDAVLFTTEAETSENGDEASSGYTATYDSEELKKLLSAPSYHDYCVEHENATRPDQTIVITPADLVPEATTADTRLINASDIFEVNEVTGEKTVADGLYCDVPEGEVLYTGGIGETVFKVNVPETGTYSMKIQYTTDTGIMETSTDDFTSEIPTTIERMIYIDDMLPFSEARYFYFPRVWEYEYRTDENGELVTANGDYLDGYEGKILTFPKDKNGNDTRPRRWEVVKWQNYYVRDWLGYEIDPLQFYFTAGEHTVTLVSNREAMIIANITLYKYEEEPLYKDWLADMKAKGVEEVTDVTPIKIQFENPDYVSVQNIIPGSDRTSPISEPIDPAVIKYNYLDTGTVNNWMAYDVEVPKAGLYSMSFRFRQNTLIGLFTSRRVKVNGEVQFREASYIRFKYNTGFQTSYATDGEQEFYFYLKEGHNTIEFEVVIGEMVKFVYDIEQMIKELNVAYQTMLMITGPVPDTYRDYGFGRLCPEAIDTIAKSADKLYEIRDMLEEMSGESSDQANALDNIGELLAKMATNEYEIAPNFLTFKNFIISLSDWLYAMLGQPCKLDNFVIGGVDEPLPKANPSSFTRMGFEAKAFIASFSMDYTTIGFADDASTAKNDVIEMWALADRETMLIQRYIIDNYFTPQTNISLRIKVITAGLQEAILAGIGPDISFMDTVNTITWGMRTALLPLEDNEGFDELMTQFPQAMKDKLTMIGQDNVEHTYGLPTTLIFPMAFYRADVLNELGIDIPECWDDLYKIMQTLGNNNLEVGMMKGLEGTELFLYQLEGGDIWADDGYRTGLDTNVALTAFQSVCEMFTKYSSPYEYDITRFRTGEIPIMIQTDSLMIYNQLMTFYELRGLWTMAPVIGTRNPETGEINRNAIANTQAMVIPRPTGDAETKERKKKLSWTFCSWYCGEDSQRRQAREGVAVAAPTSKFSTANINALLTQKWTKEERAAVEEQVKHLVGTREYPGAYIIPTYAQFAFVNAVSNGMDPAEAMLDQILDMNKEITRKRKEFGLDANEISYGFSSSESEAQD